MTPQNATLDSKCTLSRFVSYRRLSSQFQFSLSAVTLGYLSQWEGPPSFLPYTSLFPPPFPSPIPHAILSQLIFCEKPL
jgi:hypothetical protein